MTNQFADNLSEAEQILEHHKSFIEYCLDLLDSANENSYWQAALALLHFSNGLMISSFRINY